MFCFGCSVPSVFSCFEENGGFLSTTDSNHALRRGNEVVWLTNMNELSWTEVYKSTASEKEKKVLGKVYQQSTKNSTVKKPSKGQFCTCCS